MAQKLEANLNVISESALEIEYINGDLNIIQKLDDEPNDVGGLSSSELKAKFDESGNIIKRYINEQLVPAVLAADATEATRTAAEAERVANEVERVANENARVAAEAERENKETGYVAQAAASAATAVASAQTASADAAAAISSAKAAKASEESASADAASANSAKAAAEKARDEAQSIAGGKFVPIGEKGKPNGVATLDGGGKVPEAQLPEMNYEPAGAIDAHNKSLDAHPAIRDAVEAVEGNLEKVGDFRTSLRSSLGDKWLLANGDTIYAEDYPELVELLVSTLSPTVKEWGGRNYQVSYKNGYWLIGGENSSKAYVRYTNNLFGENWTEVQVYSGSSVNVCNIDFDGTYYVAAVEALSANGSAVFAYSTDLSAWNNTSTKHGGTNTYVNQVKFLNGKWVGVGCVYAGTYDKRPCIFTSTNGTNWTTKQLSSDGNLGEVSSVVYGNGYWVAYGGTNNIFITNDVDGNWTRYDGPNISNRNFFTLQFGGGVFALIGHIDGQPHIVTTSDPSTGLWVAHRVAGVSVDQVYGCYDDVSGKWFVCYQVADSTEYAKVVSSSDFENWETVTFNQKFNVEYIAHNGETWVASGYGGSTNSTGLAAFPPSATEAALPTASEDFGNVFIKAKEG